MIRIYAKTISYEDFVEDMKYIDSQLKQVQPERTTFVYQDEEGNDVLRTAHHSFEDGEMVTRWDILYHGKMVKVPAEIDEDGNVTTPAVMHDGERADIYIDGQYEEEFLLHMPTDVMANGTSLAELFPITPDTIVSGEAIEVDSEKVDKTEEEFVAGKSVQVGKIFIYNGKRYKVQKPHTTQADWNPERTLLNLFTEMIDEAKEWSSYASYEFQSMDIGTPVTDEGTTYYLIDKGQGHRKPSGQFGHHGWSENKPN